MKKYNWTIDSLKDRYYLLLQMSEKEQDKDKLDLIKKDINFLYEYIVNMEDYQVDDMPKLIECYNYFKEELLKRRFLWPDIALFKEETCNSIVIPPILKRSSFSKKDILNLTHDFYKNSLDKFFFHNFLKSFRQRNDHISFTKELNGENCLGDSFSILSLNEIFIRILRDNTIEDVLTTIHEYGHATSVAINPYHVLSPNYTFCEIDSLFMEMIAADYLKDVLKSDQPIIARANSHEIHCNTADLLGSKIDIIKTEENYCQNGYKNNKMLKEYAEKYLHFSGSKVEDLIQHGSSSYDYSISYLFAVELYYMYKNDREKAMNTLRKIVLLDKKSELEYYKELKNIGLIPNMHLREYHKGIRKDIDTLVRKKNER